MDLDELSFKYKLDKNIRNGHHDYINNYSLLFKNRNVKTLLEIGIGSVENNQMSGVWDIGYKTGNSLKCWEEYFQQAEIYGIDIFDHTDLSSGRIFVFVADQSDETQLQSCLKMMKTPLDVIIDDGSHFGDHQKISFMILEKYLSLNGIYIIEDIQPENIESFKNLSIFPEEFRNYILNTYDITYFDTRFNNNRYKSDDFMMAFTKR
jgi:demethylmacrocin O-methyltransferase